MSIEKLRKALQVSGLVSALSLATAGYAQEQIASDQNAVSRDDAVRNIDIVVTGSRIIRDGNDAPTPVSVVTSAEIQKAAPVTIADYVNQLPALAGSTSPRSHGNTALGAGANLLNLRALGVNRTLVLLNGRRVTPSTLTGAVDINTLPTALVQRVDVVTGGASAAWGSDAVSGVVNFVLDTKFKGISGSIQNGISEQGDARSFNADLSVGTSFADGRGHVILSGNYAESGVAYATDRSWFKGHKIFNNPARGAGQPRLLILPDSSLLTNNSGLVTTGPLRGLAFNAAGGVETTSFPFGPVISGVYQSGGPSGDVPQMTMLTTPLHQSNLYGRASFDVTDTMSVFVEGSYGDSHSRVTSGSLRRQAADTILIDNYYLPDSVRASMVDANVPSIGVYSNKLHLGLLTGINDREVARGIAGIQGTAGDWKWGASYQYGRAKIRTEGANNFVASHYLLAIDAVEDPITGGAICRSTLANPNNGCIPLSPLGSPQLTQAQRDYLIGSSLQHLKIRETVAEVNAQGPIFRLPAGEVNLAIGAEYRKESADADADPTSQSLRWFAANFGAFSGSYNVKEAYAELDVPILKDSGFGKSLILNGAVRLTDYSTSGSVTTWKLGATYQPVEDLQFRVTRSRDIRAPNLNDLFLSRIINTVAVGDPFRGGGNVQMLQITSGNINLKPEIAQSFTAGAIYRPGWLPGLSLTVDYYDIKIDNAIAISSSQQIVNQCFAGNQAFCDVITRGPSTDAFAVGPITSVSVIPFNAASESARGIDVELGYRRPLGSGTVDLRAMVNYVDKLDLVSPSGIVTSRIELGNNLGAYQGVPHFRGLVTAGFSTERLDLQLKGRFIGGGKMEADYGPADVNRNNVPGIFYLDAFAGLNIDAGGGKVQIFFAADNLLDKAPPVVANQDNTNATSSGTNIAVYDTIGRAYRVGARFKF